MPAPRSSRSILGVAMSRAMGIMVLLIGVAASSASRALSQNAPALPGRRLEFDLGFGGAGGGPASQIEDAMRGNGFDDTLGCDFFCTGTVSHPFTVHDGITKSFGISYAVKPHLRLRVERVSAGLGETLGLSGPTMSFLDLRSTVAAWTAAALYESGPARIGAGPSLNSILIERTDLPGGPASRATRLGLTLMLQLVTSTHARVFVEFLAAYHAVGSVTAGPFASTGATLPSLRASFNFATFQAGLGMRF